MITIAESDPVGESCRPFLYDLDVIHISSKALSNDKELTQLISSLHEEIWLIFSSSITKKYKNFLNAKVK